jgi:hypothetical protein
MTLSWGIIQLTGALPGYQTPESLSRAQLEGNHPTLQIRPLILQNQCSFCKAYPLKCSFCKVLCCKVGFSKHRVLPIELVPQPICKMQFSFCKINMLQFHFAKSICCKFILQNAICCNSHFAKSIVCARREYCSGSLPSLAHLGLGHILF